MTEEQERLINALKYAVQMEIDGKAFYTAVSQRIATRLGRELYTWLAAQEDIHRARFQAIYKAAVEKQGWPVEAVKPADIPRLGTLFGQAIREMGTSFKVDKGDIADADKGIELEIKSRDYYREQAGKSGGPVEKEFFTRISAEEQDITLLS